MLFLSALPLRSLGTVSWVTGPNDRCYPSIVSIKSNVDFGQTGIWRVWDVLASMKLAVAPKSIIASCGAICLVSSKICRCSGIWKCGETHGSQVGLGSTQGLRGEREFQSIELWQCPGCTSLTGPGLVHFPSSFNLDKRQAHVLVTSSKKRGSIDVKDLSPPGSGVGD